jgi:hypothetical protein
LSAYANDIFASLFADSSLLLERVSKLSEKISYISEKVDAADDDRLVAFKSVKNPESMTFLDFFARGIYLIVR